MQGNSNKSPLISLVLVAVGAVLFLPFLGKVHLFDWDEINFAECAREMVAAKQYFLVTINYLPFWEKPPLFIWMQALSMKLFGVSDYAARLPNAICGIITMLVLFRIGTIYKDKRFGLLWVLAYIGSMLPHFYFKTGIIDPWFNLFIFSGFYFFTRFQMHKKSILPGRNNFLYLSAFCIGLAMLTKGPVAFLVFSISVVIYWFAEKRREILSPSQAFLYLIVVSAAGGIWFAMEAITGHWNTIVQFFQYQVRLFNTQDSGHGGPFYYHFIVLLIGCFPASIFAIRGMMIKSGDEKLKEAAKLMKILFWVVLILFSIVKTKILHYSSLCYYPLTFFAVLALYEIWESTTTWKKWMGWSIGILGGILGIAIALLPVAGMNKETIIPLIKDPFAVANMAADVTWTYLQGIVGFVLLVSVISGLIFIKRGNHIKGAITFFIGTLITTNTALFLIAPNIEQITQESAVQFYQGLKGKDVYVTTIDYKSYAQYFYADIQPWKNVKCTDNEWLLKGDIDKPAYFVCKINQAEETQKEYPQLEVLYGKNGFVFFKRSPVAH
jgi:4-amino-4-deoxy-L-arabinose transferase-like glycosyltransferase